MEAARQPWPAVGALLLRDGALTVEQLEKALVEKAGSTKRLGEILVDRGYVTPTQVSRVLAEQHELPFVDLVKEPVDVGAAGLMPEALATRYGAIPVRFLGDNSILVALGDPTNVVVADDLRLALGIQIRVTAASPDMIASAIARIYGNELDVQVEDPTAEEDSGAIVIDLREAASIAPAIKHVNSIAPAIAPLTSGSRSCPRPTARR